MSFQKCPICDGTGTTVLETDCLTCKGARIISELTGLPPIYIKDKPKEPSDLDQSILRTIHK